MNIKTNQSKSEWISRRIKDEMIQLQLSLVGKVSIASKIKNVEHLEKERTDFWIKININYK